MSKQIDGGYNQYDPIRDLIVESVDYSQGSPEELLSQRCAQVYQDAARLVCTLPGEQPNRIGHHDVTLTTQPVDYITPKDVVPKEQAGLVGLVWLQQHFRRPHGSVLTYEASSSEIALLASTMPNLQTARKLFVLSQANIRYRQDIYYKPGGLRHLNFFQTVLLKIQDAHFPKDTGLEEERLADLAADRLRAKSA